MTDTNEIKHTTPPRLWTPPAEPWAMTLPLWRQPPPMATGWWPRLTWHLRRRSAGALEIDDVQIGETEGQNIQWDSPFVLHLSRNPVAPAFTELGVSLRQDGRSVAFRAVVSRAKLGWDLPHKQESSAYLAQRDLERLWPLLLFYGEAHGVQGLQGFQPQRAPADEPEASGEDVLIYPGRGIRGIEVGRSTFIDALEEFGDDCQVSCYGKGPQPGSMLDLSDRELRVWQLNYRYNANLTWDPARSSNHTRPSALRCDPNTGVIHRIGVGIYQKRVALEGGLRQGASLDDVFRQYGDRYRFERGGTLDVYTYPREGIVFWIAPSTRRINSFFIIPEEDP